MANAEEVQLWINALNLLEKNQIKDAITNFEDCAPNSKILFNIACCCMRLKDLDRAREVLYNTQYLHIHFQNIWFACGLSTEA